MSHEKPIWTNPALLLGIAAYTLTIVIWSVRQEGKIVQLEDKYAALNQRVNDLDLRGSRQLPGIEVKIDELTRMMNRHLEKSN